jgi:hypothetical protein
MALYRAAIYGVITVVIIGAGEAGVVIQCMAVMPVTYCSKVYSAANDRYSIKATRLGISRYA